MSNKFGRLNQIKLEGYKSIKKVDLKLNTLNIIIGSNGVGKSNFISFFKFMNNILEKALPTYVSQQGGANKILYFGKRTTNELKIALLFSPNAYKAKLIPDINDKLIFTEELIYFFGDTAGYQGGTKVYTLNNEGGTNSKLPNKGHTASISGHIVQYLKDWKVYHFHDTSFSANVKQTSNINNYSTLNSDASNLAPFLKNIRDNNQKSYNQIVSTIQRVAPFFHDFELEAEINNPETIRLKWKHKGTEEYFDVNDFSDGTLRFICLTTLLLQPNLPTIILLDEPELGLHPFSLKLLAGMFRKVSKKTQIIASTQSVTLADCFDIEDIIVTDRINNATEFKRLDKENYSQWIEEYTVGDLWQKNLIGGVPSYD